jgi:hypothetical protein
LGIGIRKVVKGPAYSGRSRDYREAKRLEKTDSLSMCIVCGTRVLQRERGLPGVMNTMKLHLLERYLG